MCRVAGDGALVIQRPGEGVHTVLACGVAGAGGTVVE